MTQLIQYRYQLEIYGVCESRLAKLPTPRLRKGSSDLNDTSNSKSLAPLQIQGHTLRRKIQSRPLPKIRRRPALPRSQCNEMLKGAKKTAFVLAGRAKSL